MYRNTKFIYVLIILLAISCNSTHKYCSEYIHINEIENTVDSLNLDLNNNTFYLKRGSSWGLPIVKGSFEIEDEKLLLLNEEKFLIKFIEFDNELLSSQIKIIVSIDDPFLDYTQNFIFPITVYKNENFYRTVNTGTVSDTIIIDNIKFGDIISINKDSRHLYNEAKFTISNKKYNVVHISLLRNNNINSEMMEMRISNKILKSKSGLFFKCIVN